MDRLSHYGRTQRSLELTGLALFFSLLVLNFTQPPPVELLALCALGGWLAADLLSGLAHWAFDSFGSVKTPLLGAAFIRPFREHHVDPSAMTRHDFVETNGSSCLACAPLLLAALFASPAWQAFLVCLCIGILVTNQCHKWAHMEHRPKVVFLLQRFRLVLKPEEHRLHHQPPYRSHYCTASGWLNPVLNTILRR
jgi:plasmanylethanolamine desaturase